MSTYLGPRSPLSSTALSSLYFGSKRYFFHGGNAVISHGLTKEDAVPDVEIDRALRRKAQFENDPTKHTYQE